MSASNSCAQARQR